MERRHPYLVGANAPLCGALALLLAASGLLGPGPAGGWIAHLRAQRDERRARLEAFDREHALVGPADEAERRGWAAEWDLLQERISSVPDDGALTARVAEGFQAPSVTRLEVRRLPQPAQEEEAGEGAPLQLSMPAGRERLEVRRLPVSVSFRASFEDASELLSRPGAGLPARVESIELVRRLPDVGVFLELTYFARGEGES
jgi:hypothetical protein